MSILICGFARTGQALTRLCASQFIEASVYTDNIIEEETKKEFSKSLIYYTSIDTIPSTFAEIVLSPGFNLDHKIVQYFRNLNVPIIGEIEFSFRFIKNRIIAVTGTNGKGTTCLLISSVLKNGGYNNIVLGNIGIPLADKVLDIPKDSFIILEISSAQLSTINSFQPYISVVTNIFPEHLNFHKSFDEYKYYKSKICQNQSFNDYCITNLEDDNSNEMFKNVQAQHLFFSSKVEIKNGAYLSKHDSSLTLSIHGYQNHICNLNEIQLGIKDSALIASIIGGIFNINIKIIRNALTKYVGIEHALEFCRSINGVNFFNDSKSTNQYSTIHAINSIVRNIILISGGQDDKNSDYYDLANCISKKVEFVILIGETSKKIIKELDKLQYYNFKVFSSLEEAITFAVILAINPSNVIFSPGANSRDMFDNHKRRGEIFKELIKAL